MSKQSKPTADQTEVVYCLTSASRCYGCDTKMMPGDIAKLLEKEDEREVYCLKCVKIDHLQVLPPGNAKVTKLAKKYSQTCFLIMKWSQMWKCYERSGLLVEQDALQRARNEAKTTSRPSEPG